MLVWTAARAKPARLLCGVAESTPPGTMNEELREVQHEPQVLEGEDSVPRQPASPVDPYTPETHARPGERKAWNAMRFAWIPILIVVGIVVWALVR